MAWSWAMWCVASVLSACSGGSTAASAENATRFLAVHNTLRTIGMSQVGAIHRGFLREGQKVNLPIALGASCVTIVAFASSGARQVLLELEDSASAGVTSRVSSNADAVLHACLDRPGDYVARLHMVQGSGDFLVSAWAGEDARTNADGTAGTPSGGSCEAPGLLVPGASYSGTTEDAPDEHQGSCGSSGGRERVYRLDVRRRQRIKIEVSAQFDSVLYVRKGDCFDDSTEIDCNDDVPGGVRRSQIEALFEPGTYHVFVDGYADEAGRYRIRATAEDAPTLAQICHDAAPLVTSARVQGRLSGAFDNVRASCGREARGSDVAYRFELAARARIRLTQKSTDFRPVVHVRKNCEDESTEVGCADSGRSDDEAVWTGRLEAGTYTVFADSAEEGASGAFALSAEALPEPVPPGLAGDTCGDAISLGAAAGQIEGDTFGARDDMASSCAAPGAADVVYRLDVPRRARLSASLGEGAGHHVLSLVASCAGPSAQGTCGASLNEEIGPGTHFLVVDAADAETLGRFSLRYRVRDLAGVEMACSKARDLAMSRTVQGSMAGAVDAFETSCAEGTAGGGALGAGAPGGVGSTRQWPDRVYRFALARKQSIRLSLRTQKFRARLSVRQVCADDGSELRCMEGREDAKQVDLDRDLDAGVYYAVVEAAGAGSQGGTFWLSLAPQPTDTKKRGAPARSP